MGRCIFNCLLAVAAMLLVAIMPERAMAQAAPCHAGVPAGITPQDVARADLAWRCDGSDPDLTAPAVAIRFAAAQPDARHLQTRIGQFDSVTLVSIAHDGELVLQRHEAARIAPLISDRLFALPLPRTGPEVSAQFAVFEKLEHPSVIERAELVQITAENSPGHLADALLVAMIAGFLLLPILIDLAFFRALKARFLLLHAALAFSMAAYLLTSGIVAAFIPISILQLDTLTVLSFSVTTTFGILFFCYFIEPDRMDPRLRLLIGYSPILIVAVTALRLLNIEMFRPFAVKLYFSAYAPLLILMVYAMVHAVRRGSRAVWFQIIAWVPLLGLSIVRLTSMLGAELDYIEGSWIFRLGAAFEVIVTALGIVDRVIAIKRQRDTARAHAAVLENLAERDALTGLLNRRAIEARFDALRAEGFVTLAVLDLDHFKQINDRYGHNAGDTVLQSVASALQSEDDNLLAFRVGGEEFILLARGKQAIARVEARRQAITATVAREGGLPEPVTASIGIVNAPHDALADTSFEALYARADRLLYEAKAAGRNRTMSEKLRVFSPRRRVERRTAA